MVPLVSLIIPTYYRNERLIKAIDSARYQTYHNIEIIVIDDSGVKHVKEVEDQYRDAENVKFYQNIGKGGNVARNYGVSKSNGEIITFLDDDDELFPEKIYKQYSLLNDMLSVWDDIVIYCGTSIYKDNQQIKEWIPTWYGCVHNIFLVYNFASNVTLFMKKNTFLKSGGFDEELEALQEWDLNIRLSKFAYYFPVKLPLVKVNRHTTNKMVEMGNKYWTIRKSIIFKYKSEWKISTYIFYYFRLLKLYIQKPLSWFISSK